MGTRRESPPGDPADVRNPAGKGSLTTESRVQPASEISPAKCRVIATFTLLEISQCCYVHVQSKLPTIYGSTTRAAKCIQSHRGHGGREKTRRCMATARSTH